MKKRVIKVNSKIQIGLPSKKLNSTTANALLNTIKKHKENISNCYLFMKGVQDQEKPLITLGILFTRLNEESVNSTMQDIVNTLQKHLSAEQELDLMILNNQKQIGDLLQNLEGATFFSA